MSCCGLKRENRDEENGRTQAFETHRRSASFARHIQIQACRGGTEDERRSGWGSAGGDLRGGGATDKTNVMRRRPGASGHQYASTNAGEGWREGEMAERALVCRRVGVVMPDHAERCPEHQHKECYGDNHAPDLFSVRHF